MYIDAIEEDGLLFTESVGSIAGAVVSGSDIQATAFSGASLVDGSYTGDGCGLGRSDGQGADNGWCRRRLRRVEQCAGPRGSMR